MPSRMGIMVAVLAGMVATQAEPMPLEPRVIAFGIDAGAVPVLADMGVKPEIATVWVGAWNLHEGWRGTDEALRGLAAHNVTPAVHFYYWGDDLSPACFEQGCHSLLHGVHKDQAEWWDVAEQLVSHLHSTLEGRPVLILLESEFNKISYEPLDTALAEKAQWIKASYPEARIVLPFGNWHSPGWPEWDEAAAASDFVGLQGLRASTRDSNASYASLVEDSLRGVRRLHQLFDKPVIMHDIGASTYPEPQGIEAQAETVSELFERLDALGAAGVHAVIYRSWMDTPTMDPNNHFGPAERHWGLAWLGGTAKPAGETWIEGIKQARERYLETRTGNSDPSVTSGDQAAATSMAWLSNAGSG
jgi:hypothetical protein